MIGVNEIREAIKAKLNAGLDVPVVDSIQIPGQPRTIQPPYVRVERPNVTATYNALGRRLQVRLSVNVFSVYRESTEREEETDRILPVVVDDEEINRLTSEVDSLLIEGIEVEGYHIPYQGVRRSTGLGYIQDGREIRQTNIEWSCPIGQRTR